MICITLSSPETSHIDALERQPLIFSTCHYHYHLSSYIRNSVLTFTHNNVYTGYVSVRTGYQRCFPIYCVFHAYYSNNHASTSTKANDKCCYCNAHTICNMDKSLCNILLKIRSWLRHWIAHRLKKMYNCKQGKKS